MSSQSQFQKNYQDRKQSTCQSQSQPCIYMFTKNSGFQFFFSFSGSLSPSYWLLAWTAWWTIVLGVPSFGHGNVLRSQYFFQSSQDAEAFWVAWSSWGLEERNTLKDFRDDWFCYQFVRNGLVSQTFKESQFGCCDLSICFSVSSTQDDQLQAKHQLGSLRVLHLSLCLIWSSKSLGENWGQY